jgi:hypothetical protein
LETVKEGRIERHSDAHDQNFSAARGSRKPKAVPQRSAMGKTWLAYRIKCNSSEKYDGVIRAHSRGEAENKAQTIFGCLTDAERRRIYVWELQMRRHVSGDDPQNNGPVPRIT